MRVPTPNVSVVDLVVELNQSPVSAETINATLKAAAENELKGIMAYNELPLVSSDYNGDPHSSIVDGLSTMVIEDNLVKVVAWYDNEWGYSCRVADLAVYMGKKVFNIAKKKKKRRKGGWVEKKKTFKDLAVKGENGLSPGRFQRTGG